MHLQILLAAWWSLIKVLPRIPGAVLTLRRREKRIAAQIVKRNRWDSQRRPDSFAT